jgi:hypothetical protein
MWELVVLVGFFMLYRRLPLLLPTRAERREAAVSEAIDRWDKYIGKC